MEKYFEDSLKDSELKTWQENVLCCFSSLNTKFITGKIFDTRKIFSINFSASSTKIIAVKIFLIGFRQLIPIYYRA